MNTRLAIASAIAVLSLSGPAAGATYSLNADWRFMKAPKTIPLAQAKASVETAGVKVEAASYDDSSWELVSVPHPINAHDSFDNRAVDAGEASFWRGMAFYRKRFALDAAPTGKAFITFETVRQSVYLWVNAKFAGYYEAGIVPCAFDVTALLRAGENLICVATDNCSARGAKLFMHETIPGHAPGDMSGAAYQWNTADFNEVQGGLVGNVSLVLKPSKTYLTLPYYNNLKTVGTYVTAKDFDFEKGAATIKVRAEVRNETGKAVNARLKVEIFEPRNTLKSSVSSVCSVVEQVKDADKVFLTALESDVYENASQPTRVASPETMTLEATCRATGLVFWSPDTPHLYDVKVSLVGADGMVLDAETIRTGFREVRYDAKSGGLKINGRNTWLTGYAQRSTDEWAAIGVAPDWLQDCDAALIRKSNANFVRWMHVAPKPAPVRAFDKFGIVNAAPAGDKEGDVSGRAWAQRVEAMRDTMIYFRNSPSVVFWEAGNNQIAPAHMKEMVELKKRIDPDGWRFMGCRTLQTKEQIAEAEYVGTMLHRHEMPAYESMKALEKFIPMMETEYARQESPRRSWDDFTPPDYDYRGRYLNGGKKETGYDVYDQTQEDFALSTAKEYAEFYGARASGRGARTYSAVAALCWTDSNQHGRQSFSENCRSSGRVDAVRIPKVSFDVFRVMQSEDPAVMLVGHWSYPKLTRDSYMYPVKKYNGHFMEETGEMAQRDPLHKTVYAIGSVHCASVELIVNGKSRGVVEKPDHVFAYPFPNIDVTERGTAEVVARDKAGKEIARHTVKSFAGNGTVDTKVTTGPMGWLADGSDIAVIDFKLVDGKGTIHPYASDKIKFRLEGDAKFMGGWNSGVFDEASPIGKDFVNLECGQARVFVKAGRRPGKVILKWDQVGRDTHTAPSAGARVPRARSGEIVLELKPVEVKGGLSATPQQAFPANSHTFARKTSADAVQDFASSGSTKAIPYTIRVNSAPVVFATGMGEPVKPDDNTGVCCAYEPVLAALKDAGVKMEYAVEPKRIPANKKWLRKLSPTPFVPMVTVKVGGHEIDVCAGFTELFIDNGKDKNLTNCEIYGVGKKNAKTVCGELAALIGYIPEVKIEIDGKRKIVDLKIERTSRMPEIDGIKTSGTQNTEISYQIAADLPLKHDGYVVERLGTGKRERVAFVVKAKTERSFLYANYESNRWLRARSYPFVRDPHFKLRALDVNRSPEPLRDWIAATGANAVYFKRGRPDAKKLRECAALGVDAYSFLYGCDASKWNRARYDAFVAVHPAAKGVSPEKSWEKGMLCPSDAATASFFGEAVREIAVPEVAGVVVCLWDDYGLNCVCDRCKRNGLAGNWGRQVAFAVKAWENALMPLGKKLVVRTWSSGASHWLNGEWVHAPGYGGPSGEPLSVWGKAMEVAGASVLFQTKVYNADCQPDPPFSALLQVAPRRDIAEWQIAGQTLGRQYFPASVVAQTARQFARVRDLVSADGGVMLYAGAYKRDGYAALSDRLNSVNIHVWRQLSWNPDEDVEALWREWAEPLYGGRWQTVVAAMKASEAASVASFSPLGLGAPTESVFARNVERRESLLRYTNRYFLPDGKASLEPTQENVGRVIEQKDAALSVLDTAIAKLGKGIVTDADLVRFGWLRSHLAVSRELDANLWRLRLLKRQRTLGRPTDALLREIQEGADRIRISKCKFPREIGSPVPLMKDICSQARE